MNNDGFQDLDLTIKDGDLIEQSGCVQQTDHYIILYRHVKLWMWDEHLPATLMQSMPKIPCG